MSSSDQLGGDASLSLSQSPACRQACICGTCKKSVNIKGMAAVVTCVSCASSFHVSCIVNKFVATNGTALKNSVQWLADLLHSGNFQFICNTCIDNKKAGGFSVNQVEMGQQRRSIALQASDESITLKTLAENVSLLAKQVLDLK